MNINDWIGFSGVAILLFAYFLSLINRISKDHIVYIGMNIAGAGIACLASALINYWPFIILEGAWALISFFALVKYFRKT